MNVWGYDFEGNPIPSAEEFSRLMADPRRSLGLTTCTTPEGDEITVSTVHLLIDHNWSGEGPPVLWETMCFIVDGVASQRRTLWSDLQWRYDSAEAALKGHRFLVQIITEGLPIDGLPASQTIRGGDDS